MTGATREEIGQAVFDCIERYYNRQRLHSTRDYKTPVKFELEALKNPSATPEGVEAA